MKLIVALAAFIVWSSAAKTSKKPIAEYFSDFAGEPNINLIINEDERPPTNFQGDVMKAKTISINTMQGKGKFNYNYETENGISVASIGKLKDEKTFVISGSYTYTGANGQRYRVRYTADEFGYHPVTELDDQPEFVINPAKPAPPLPPAPRSNFASVSSFSNGNNQQDQNGKIKFSNEYNGGSNGLTNGNVFNGGYELSKRNGLNNGDELSNRNGLNNGNSLTSAVDSLDGRFGGENGYSNGNGSGNNRYKSGNGFNTIDDQLNQFDRSGKSIEQQTDVIFNNNFVSVAPSVNINPENPNNLYLPPKPTYLPPTH